MSFTRSSTKIIFLIAFAFVSILAEAQQLVQKPDDIFLICQRDSEFVGKPLKFLLKQIRPKIKMVFAEGGWFERAPQFSFFFTSIKGFDSIRKEGKLPLRITVYLKEFFKWRADGHERRNEDYFQWTGEDEVRYGNLIIGAIRVAGEFKACDNEPIPIL